MNGKKMLRLRMVALLALPAAVFASASGVGAASPHQMGRIVRAGSTSTWAIYGYSNHVTTTSKQHLQLTVSADAASPGGSSTVDVALNKGAVGTSPIYESHAWTFSVPAGDVTASGSGAAINVKSSDIGSFGALNLHFSVTSHHAAKCAIGSQTTYKGTLSGTISFNPQISSWGKVASQHISMPGTTLTADNQCIPNFPTGTCAQAIIWSSPTHTISGSTTGSESFVGFWSHIAGQQPYSGVEASRNVSISLAHGTVNRSDIVMTTAPAPQLSGKSLKITTRTHGSSITGAATLKALGKSTSYNIPCKRGGKSSSETYSTYSGKFSWQNGSQVLMAHMANTGFSIPNNGSSTTATLLTEH